MRFNHKPRFSRRFGEGAVVSLFNPRQQAWSEHFIANGPIVVGVTPIGRATIRVLDFNAASRVQLRAATR
jgi:hypothetical protein